PDRGVRDAALRRGRAAGARDGRRAPGGGCDRRARPGLRRCGAVLRNVGRRVVARCSPEEGGVMTATTDRLGGARVAVEDTPEEAAFRAEVREWFAANANPRDVDGETGNYFAMADNDPETHRKHVERCKAWQRTLYDGGWAGITLPKEYGGRGGERWQERIFRQEQAKSNVDTGLFAVSLGMVAPTLLVHGTEEQK